MNGAKNAEFTHTSDNTERIGTFGGIKGVGNLMLNALRGSYDPASKVSPRLAKFV